MLHQTVASDWRAAPWETSLQLKHRGKYYLKAETLVLFVVYCLR